MHAMEIFKKGNQILWVRVPRFVVFAMPWTGAHLWAYLTLMGVMIGTFELDLSNFHIKYTIQSVLTIGFFIIIIIKWNPNYVI